MTIDQILKQARPGFCFKRACWSHGPYIVVVTKPWFSPAQVLECGDVLSEDDRQRWSPTVEELLADDWDPWS